MAPAMISRPSQEINTQPASHPPPFFSSNPNPKTITWERLETRRLQKLGLGNQYSRHFNVLRTHRQDQDRGKGSNYGYNMPRAFNTSAELHELTLQGAQTHARPVITKGSKNKANSLAPFCTLGKPTCGYFFSRMTDHRKQNFGIPPSDLVKWRSQPRS